MTAAEDANIPNGTTRYRLDILEKEQERQRLRIHDIIGEQQALRLLIQHTTDEVVHLAEDVQALKRAFYTFAVSTVGAAVVFAFTVFALLGRS